MGYYDGSEGIDEDNNLKLAKKALDNLLKISRRITTVAFTGGEPFLFDRLHEAVAYASASKRVSRITIHTNGTVVPTDENLKCLNNKKVTVEISEFPGFDTRKAVDVLRKSGIRYKKTRQKKWIDYGGIQNRGLSKSDLRRSFAECRSAECKTIFMGSLFTCPRSAHSYMLRLFDEDRAVYVNLATTPENMLKQRIKELFSTPYVEACKFCNPVWTRGDIGCTQDKKPEKQTHLLKFNNKE